jgi:hypothetical protein
MRGADAGTADSEGGTPVTLLTPAADDRDAASQRKTWAISPGVSGSMIQARARDSRELARENA